jgi:hypothetical protein
MLYLPIRLCFPVMHNLLLLLHSLIILSLSLYHCTPFIKVSLAISGIVPLLLICQLLYFIHLVL